MHCHSPSITESFREDLLHGLGQARKQLKCKYFYDERGSRLFDQICKLDEYYPTRIELSIMQQHINQMAKALGSNVMLVEFGSGSSTKTRILLDGLQKASAYVPVDISVEHLLSTAAKLRESYPELEILPVSADFTATFSLPQPLNPPSRTVVYFPGSTIGNFEPPHDQAILARIADLVDDNGSLLIGIDLQKNPKVIEAAYNDAEGVTAQFTLNLLKRANDELGADFQLDQYHHRAIYNTELARIETYVVSDVEQVVSVGNEKFLFERGEQIIAEYSHKYKVSGFAAMASSAGFQLDQYWTDPDEMFAVLHLVQTGVRRPA